MKVFKVSQNLRLIEYFTSEFYSNKTSELAHIVSPDFNFKINNTAERDFEEYAESMLFMTSNTKFVMGDISSDNDDDFILNWEMSMYDESREILVGTGHSKFSVKKGLLQSVHIIYDDTEKVFQLYARKWALKK